MSDHSKEYRNLEELLNAGQAMTKFQRIHNVIRKDYLELLRITEFHKENEVEFDALYRASLTRLFTIIEADIYGLNVLDSYEDYDDKASFIEKFKRTYKQICKTWKKEDLQRKYFDRKIEDLKNLRKKRDELIHPKEMHHVHKASHSDFDLLKKVFEDYDQFINDLMNGFFISVKLDSSFPFNSNV